MRGSSLVHHEDVHHHIKMFICSSPLALFWHGGGVRLWWEVACVPPNGHWICSCCGCCTSFLHYPSFSNALVTSARDSVARCPGAQTLCLFCNSIWTVMPAYYSDNSSASSCWTYVMIFLLFVSFLTSCGGTARKASRLTGTGSYGFAGTGNGWIYVHICLQEQPAYYREGREAYIVSATYGWCVAESAALMAVQTLAQKAPPKECHTFVEHERRSQHGMLVWACGFGRQ